MENKNQHFEEIFDKYNKMVYKICFSYLRSHFDSEDILQDSFMDLFYSKKTFESEEHEKYYLIRIVINNCKTHLRKNSKRILMTDDELSRIKSEENINEVSIIDIISILPPKYKEIIILKYSENLSYKEISTILKITEVNARKRVSRAIKLLEKEWEE